MSMPLPQQSREERDAHRAPDGFAWCGECQGFGWRMVPNIKAPWHEERSECEDCDGTGVIEEDET